MAGSLVADGGFVWRLVNIKLPKRHPAKGNPGNEKVEESLHYS
jgi:hypothetical protein